MYIINMCGSLDIITTTCIILSLVISPLSATPKGTLIMPCGPSGHVSINSSLVGQPWIMCFQPGTEKLQRLIISHVFPHRNGLEMEKFCTKLNSSSWSVGNGSLPLPTNNVIVTCPGPRMNTMCLKAFNGSTNDIGWWKFTIVDNIYGNREELCSKFLILKRRDFPRLKSECIDFQNPMVALDMGFEEGSEVEFNLSVSYKDGTHLCHGRNSFACNVSRAVMKDILEMGGSNVADYVRVMYQSSNLNIVLITDNTLEVKEECGSSMNSDSLEDRGGLGLGQSLALILSIGILSISAIAGLILYKKGKCAKCASFFQQLIKKQHNEQQPDNEQQPGNEQQPDNEQQPGNEQQPDNEQQPGNEQQPHNDLLLKRKQPTEDEPVADHDEEDSFTGSDILVGLNVVTRENH